MARGCQATYRITEDAQPGIEMSAESGWYLIRHKLPGTKSVS